MRLVNWLRDLYSIRVPQKYDIFIAMGIVTAAFLAFVIVWHPAARLVQGPPGQPGKDGRNATKTAQPNAPPGKRTTTVTPYGSGHPFTPTSSPTPTTGGQRPQPHPSSSSANPKPTHSSPTERPPSSPTKPPESTPAEPPAPTDDPSSNSPAPPSSHSGQPPASNPHSDRPTFTETAPEPSYTG